MIIARFGSLQKTARRTGERSVGGTVERGDGRAGDGAKGGKDGGTGGAGGTGGNELRVLSAEGKNLLATALSGVGEEDAAVADAIAASLAYT